MLIKLETVKKNKWLLDQFGGYPCRYQCRQHGEPSYSRIDNNGYTDHREAAGVWHFKKCYDLIAHCGPEKQIHFELSGIPYEILVKELASQSS